MVKEKHPPFKTVYLYDPTTGVFTDFYNAQLSPLDESGTYLCPVCSTDIAPPVAQINQAVVFADGAWSVVPDFRGQTWFDSSTGDPVVITAIGQPASNLVQSYTPPAPSLATLQAQATAQINATADQALRAALIAKGIITQDDIDTHTDLLVTTQVNSLLIQQGSS